MIKLFLLLMGASFFVFFYLLFRWGLSRKRPIHRVGEWVPLEVKGNEMQIKKENQKVAVKLIAKGIHSSGILKGYVAGQKGRIQKANVKVSMEEYVGIKGVLILLLILFAGLWIQHTAALLFFSLLALWLGWVLPDVYLEFLAQRRKKILNRQLCEALKIIANAIKTGQSFFQAMQIMTEEIEGPVAEEFSTLLNEIKLGMTIEEAMENMVQRVESEDLKFVTTAVLIQRQAGGNLSEVLENIAETIKGRISLQRELAAASAQGKMSAAVLALIPVAITVYVLTISEQTHGVLLTETAGIVMLSVAVGMELLGIYFIRKILHVKF